MQITLRAARVNAGLKQLDVAKMLGVDRTTISRYERTKAPDVNTARKLCEIYNVDLSNVIFLTKSGKIKTA